MNRIIRCLALLTILLSVIPAQATWASPITQTATPGDDGTVRLLASMTPEEKVGQLFLVTFKGTAVDQTSPILELISRNHIGGVMLLAGNDNFTDQDFAGSTQRLTTNLQAIAAGVAPIGTSTPVKANPNRQFIPLLIGAQGSSVALNSRLGLPSAMALGATWSFDRSQALGSLQGSDFAALGLNLLVGPVLDVVETPQPAGPADQGAQAFGGSAYWVGKLGQAYIEGVHSGSQNHVAVIAQHFPGYGAGDRSLGDQIPAVNKSISALASVDLAPFLQVAQGQPGGADGFLVSHIRYAALQGPLNDTVRPISLDQHAMNQLFGLPQLASWRAAGGVTMSDALGSRALRRFQDPAEKTFSAFAVARDAFLAGNDLLYVAGFESSGDDPAATIKGVLSQFIQKYQEDATFASRVNEACARILKLKKKLYGDFSFESVIAATNGLNALGNGADDALAITQAAATLLSPNGLTSRPTRNQRVVFVTDTRPTQLCSTCAPTALLPITGFMDEVVRLYGPKGTGETTRQNLTSLSFTDVTAFLDNKVSPTPSPQPTNTAGSEQTATPEATAIPSPGVEDALRSADWVVFATLDINANSPDSLALRRLLGSRPDLLAGKQVIVFAFDAPYYLDATEVAQLTAYYGLFNHTQAAIQVAAQVLFQEITPSSASPVSIAGTGYDLSNLLQPDPNQDIKLLVESRPVNEATRSPLEPTPTAPALGVTISLKTSPILDKRGHPVPDGTMVHFYVTYVSQGISNPVEFAVVPTVDGVASTTYLVDKTGALELSASSGLAQRSDRIGFNVTSPGQVGTPTVEPPPSRTPTVTTGPTATPPQTSTPAITATPQGPVTTSTAVSGLDLFMTVLTLAVMGFLAARVTRSRTEAVSDGVKLFLVIAIGALLAYNYYALKMPGYETLRDLGFLAVPFTVWTGGLIGFGVGWWWLRSGIHERP